MVICLIRHGLTALSEEKRYQGALDTPLSQKGQKVLRRADFQPGWVYVSPMRRAVETAEILFPEAERIIVPDLREMDFGAFEGKGWWELENDPDYQTWVDGGCIGRCPGGEDLAGFSDRVCAAFEEIVRQELDRGEDRLTVVAHGGTQMAVLGRWARPAQEYYRWQTECGRGWLLDTAYWPDGLDVTGEFDGLG